MSLTKLSLGGNYDVIYKLYQVIDIPAGDGNIEKLFYNVFIVKLDLSGWCSEITSSSVDLERYSTDLADQDEAGGTRDIHS